MQQLGKANHYQHPSPFDNPLPVAYPHLYLHTNKAFRQTQQQSKSTLGQINYVLCHCFYDQVKVKFTIVHSMHATFPPYLRAQRWVYLILVRPDLPYCLARRPRERDCALIIKLPLKLLKRPLTPQED